MYAMDHTTHFEHRIESRPARRLLRRASSAPSSTPTDSSDGGRSDITAPWPLPEFAD